MKICRIVYAFSPYSFGGADIYAEKISNALEKDGHASVIITINPCWADTVEKHGNRTIYRFHPLNVSTVHNIGKKPAILQGIWSLLDIYNLYSYKKIKGILKKECPNVVHVHTPLDITTSVFDAVKSLKLPLVFTLHDYLLLCRRVVLLHSSGEICTDKNINPLCKLYRKFVNKVIDNKVDVIVGSSKFVLDMHKKYGFFKNTKSVVLSHGIELNSLNGEARREKGFCVLYVGSLTKHKGVHILIEAFKQIKNDSVKLLIIGDGVYAKELKYLAKGDSRIIFSGDMPNKDVQKFFKVANVTVVPSAWYDVRPNVIVESFRSGVAVIASNIGGIPELVKEKYNGFLFEPGNVKQLRDMLERLIKEPQVLLELGKNALESVKEIEMSRYIKKLVNVYDEAIEINKGR
jgi:glycosyltransferase involved in cell wall biosynthesis